MPANHADDRLAAVSDSAVGTDEPVLIAEEFLSVLMSNWVTAMQPHLDALISLAAPAPEGAHQVSHLENAHAIAVATMLVFALESNAGRLAALGRLPGDLGPDADALGAIRRVLAEGRGNSESVIELFVLRDAIVHNHIWEIRLERGPEWTGPVSLVAAESRRGDIDTKKYRAVAIEVETNRTQQLGLHLVPTEVRRWDIAQMLPVACAAFDALASCDLVNMRSLAMQRVRVQGLRLPQLRELIEPLQLLEADPST